MYLATLASARKNDLGVGRPIDLCSNIGYDRERGLLATNTTMGQFALKTHGTLASGTAFLAAYSKVHRTISFFSHGVGNDLTKPKRYKGRNNS